MSLESKPNYSALSIRSLLIHYFVIANYPYCHHVYMLSNETTQIVMLVYKLCCGVVKLSVYHWYRI
jgi:hypothetical protein